MNMMRLYVMCVWGFLGLVSSACSTTAPDGVVPVNGFEADRYLGTWYEIARLDHRFERGLEGVSATYSEREDGGIDVLNKGYNTQASEWERAKGKAYFVGDNTTGHLKVSFFGPFYGSYVVFNLDADYQHSYVSGPDRSYLWYLSRTPNVTDRQKAAFKTAAAELGFDVDDLIWVDQTRNKAGD